MNARPFFPLAIAAAVLALGSQAPAALFPSQALTSHLLCCGTETKNAARHALADDSFGKADLGGGTLFAAASSDAGVASASSAGSSASGTSSSPTAEQPPADTSKPAKPIEEENGYVKLGFDQLAGFVFKAPPFDPAANPNVTPPSGEEQIPEWLKKLSGRKAMVTGFMLPLKMKDNLVTDFLLLSDPMACCFGGVPEMNQWIVVKMKGEGVRPIQDVPLTFYGELKIGAIFENGYMTGIYSMDGEKMAEMKG